MSAGVEEMAEQGFPPGNSSLWPLLVFLVPEPTLGGFHQLWRALMSEPCPQP